MKECLLKFISLEKASCFLRQLSLRLGGFLFRFGHKELVLRLDGNGDNPAAHLHEDLWISKFFAVLLSICILHNADGQNFFAMPP